MYARSSNFDEARIKDVLPALSSQLKDEFSSLRSSISVNHAMITRTSTQVENLSKSISEILSGRASVAINFNVAKAVNDHINGDSQIAHSETLHCDTLQTGVGTYIYFL